jgi:hypothetical protein
MTARQSVKDEVDKMIRRQPQPVRAFVLSPERWRAFCREVGAGPGVTSIRYQGYAESGDVPPVLVVER